MENELIQSPIAKKPKNEINFQDMPLGTDEILKNSRPVQPTADFNNALPIPFQENVHSSYLQLVLSPNLRELEMMIRGLEYVRVKNEVTGKEEVALRKIPNHPLNEYGVNQIMQQLRVFSSPEIKLGRKRERDYYNSVQHVCRTIVRLIYKNLRNFGMDTQVKQRHAKAFCDAIIEIVDSSYSRSIEGKENDLSRATNFNIEANLDNFNDPHKLFTKDQKEQLKN